MKVTEPGLNTLIDNLNTLICEDSLLTRQERETLVRAVAAIDGKKGRKKTASLIRVFREPVIPGRKTKKPY